MRKDAFRPESPAHGRVAMRPLHLTPQQRFRLRQQLHDTHDAGVLRRTLALLHWDAGRSFGDIAAALRVTRRSGGRWLAPDLHAPTPRTLRDHRGHAHHSAWDEELVAVLRAAVAKPPAPWGYRNLEWTVSLLQQHLERWDGRHWSDATSRRQLDRLGQVWKRPRYVLIPDPHRARKMRRICKQVKELGPRTALLFEDETDLLRCPPWRAGGAKRGRSAEVPGSGRNARRVVFGAIQVGTGHRLLRARRRQRGADFRALLELLPGPYRGWEVWLLLDEDPSPTAKASVGLAREYGLGLLWLPKRWPELNGMDHLGGEAKDEVCANHQDSSLDHLVDRFLQYIQGLSAEEALRQAGILSDAFWLKDVWDN
jgi:hypothetical protein